MQSTCKVTGVVFPISEEEVEFCEANGIPFPTISPFCRMRSQIIFRNRINLYRTTCAFSGKSMLSSYPEESSLIVYDVDVWESDGWERSDYARSYDFSRPFFEQFYELFCQVPLPSLGVVRSTMENSDFANGITAAKNCYLIFSSSHNEDCMFCKALWRCNNIVNSIFAHDSELCYGCTDIRNCYNLKYSEHCTNCSDSTFLFNCHSCSHCYGCRNLSTKEFYFFNEKLSKDEYLRRVNEIELGSYEVLQQELARFEEIKQAAFFKYYFGRNNENSTGNFITNNKNCINCFYVSNCEDIEYGLFLDNAKNCMFHTMFGNNAELIYNCETCGDDVYNLKFCSHCYMGSSNLEYCMYCLYGSSNCFGCIGMKRSSYFILNRQYTKAEYFDLLPRVKSHMVETGEYGKFFPIEFSPFYYNESDALEYFPLTKEDALGFGFKWKDRPERTAQPVYDIPDHISDVPESILNEKLVCESTGKQYKLTKAELNFYKKNSIPIPRESPLERLKKRCTFFKVGDMQAGKCGISGEPFMSVYDSSNGQVYSEKCFLEEMY